MLRTVHKIIVSYLLPLSLVALIHTELLKAVDRLFGIALWEQARDMDLALTMVVAVPLLLMSRNRIAYLVLMTLLMTLFHVGNALKIQILGGPVLPDDLFAAHALFLIMKNWQVVLAGGLLLVIAGFLVASLTVKTWPARVGAACLAVLVALGVFLPPADVTTALDQRYGNIVWNQRGNYESRGPFLYLVQELERARATKPMPPTADQVRTALDFLSPPRGTDAVVGGGLKPRTVIVVLMESFFDPSVLTDAKFSRDPFHKDFRQLWRQAGFSHALSPVFGGYTANAEFEVLCGYPVTMDAVFFEKGLTKDVPCLPRLLGKAGYTTIASHPNIPVFWNRVNAYRRVGFDVYRSKDDFDLDDMNGEYLSDGSLYRQVLDHVGPLMSEGRPSLSYVVTFFGHLDYPLNENRDIVVRSRKKDELLERYANTVYDKSKAFMGFVRDVQARDPDALIVAFGDHLPFLGPNFGGYTESGLLQSNRSEFDDAMFRTMVATPLIVIDGKRGPVKTGDRPLYEVPSLVLGLLGETNLSAVNLAARPGASAAVRPLPGMLFLSDESTKAGKGGPRAAPTICRFDETDSEPCQGATAWLKAVETVSRDLFSGHQHVLTLIPAPVPPNVLEPDHLVSDVQPEVEVVPERILKQ